MKIETNPSVSDFFRTVVRSILQNRGYHVQETTEFYVVNLLTNATKSQSENAEQNYFEIPLAVLFNKAIAAHNIQEKYILLKHLGDQSLFISGFFGDSLQSSAVDTKYYISMGSTAYSELSCITRHKDKGTFFPEVFNEMAEKFPVFVDLFSEISEQSKISNDQDIIRMYERWLYTKSQRLLEKLEEAGIHPLDENGNLH